MPNFSPAVLLELQTLLAPALKLADQHRLHDLGIKLNEAHEALNKLLCDAGLADRIEVIKPPSF